MTIELTPEQRIKIEGAESVYKVMREIFSRETIIDQDKEHFWVVGLSYTLKILYIELVALGTYKEVNVEPMEVFSWALQKRCTNIILVHNHPSNALKPSKADKDITDRLIQVGKIVDLHVTDHLIISTDSYYSFVDEGLFTELEGSTKYVPPFVLVDEYKKQAEKERKRADKQNKVGRKQERKEIARKLKESGAELQYISEMTGIPIAEIEKF